MPDFANSTGTGGQRAFADDLQLSVSPKLVQNDLEIQPLAVTRLGGTLPWDTSSKQLQCGETVTDSGGEQAHRLVFKAIITHSQFKDLGRMRNRGDTVKLVSAGYTGPATFDELKWDRIPDANGIILKNGENSNQPIYEIQLQSKEDEEGV